MVVEDLGAAIAAGDRALQLARRLDDTEATVYALSNIGAAELQAEIEDGLAKLEEALALALEHDLHDYAGRAYFNIVRCATTQRRFDLADAYLGPGLGYCRERGLDTWRLYLLGARARLELDRGRWDHATESATLVLRDPRSAPAPRGMALTALGLVRARRGDPDATAPLSEEQLLAWPTGELFRFAPVAAARGEAAWLARETAAGGRRRTPRSHWRCDVRHPGWSESWRAGGGAPDCATGYHRGPRQSRTRVAGGGASAGSQALVRARLPVRSGDGAGGRQRRSAAAPGADELQALGARPAAAIVARRLRERGVRGVRRGPRAHTRENPPASPRASSRCWHCWPRGCGIRRSRHSW